MYLSFILVLVEQLNNLKVKWHQKHTGVKGSKQLETNGKYFYNFSFLFKSKQKKKMKIDNEEQVILYNKECPKKLNVANNKPILTHLCGAAQVQLEK